MNYFGEKLRTIRTQKGIGLNELARRLEVSPAYLSNLETGKTETIHLNFVDRLKQELNFTPVDLFIEINGSNEQQFSQFDYRLKRANQLLKQLEVTEPKVADYLLSVMEQGLDLYLDKDVH